ncbi:PepSY-associated TM helix domain-containing protein [Qipengyuania sp. MTN3-11]|uniref:PepSY-associated TM helix domain-containing protein n=1 Tax=Qipengyuania sp. MTN3-11 TaxID=3056557 RepID=UPI0036F41C89
MHQVVSRPGQSNGKRRALVSPFWRRQFHTWHWMSSAICLVGMILFAVTGITLNHAGSIEADPRTRTSEATLPPELLSELRADPRDHPQDAVKEWLEGEFDIELDGRLPEWTEAELYVPLPRAGGDGWIAVDLETGEAMFEDTDRGMIATLNDLHKGRDTGLAWSWFIDIFAGACVVFCVTGLLLLQLHARKRPSTWPIVGAGFAIPLFLVIFLVH